MRYDELNIPSSYNGINCTDSNGKFIDYYKLFRISPSMSQEDITESCKIALYNVEQEIRANFNSGKLPALQEQRKNILYGQKVLTNPSWKAKYDEDLKHEHQMEEMILNDIISSFKEYKANQTVPAKPKEALKETNQYQPRHLADSEPFTNPRHNKHEKTDKEILKKIKKLRVYQIDPYILSLIVIGTVGITAITKAGNVAIEKYHDNRAREKEQIVLGEETSEEENKKYVIINRRYRVPSGTNFSECSSPALLSHVDLRIMNDCYVGSNLPAGSTITIPYIIEENDLKNYQYQIDYNGENLKLLAAKYEIDFPSLVAMNPDKIEYTYDTENGLRAHLVGDSKKLNVPAFEALNDEKRVMGEMQHIMYRHHILHSGETIEDIAKDSNVSAQYIRLSNKENIANNLPLRIPYIVSDTDLYEGFYSTNIEYNGEDLNTIALANETDQYSLQLLNKDNLTQTGTIKDGTSVISIPRFSTKEEVRIQKDVASIEERAMEQQNTNTNQLG